MQDVFLSFSPEDRTWVAQQLVPRLRQAGLTVLAGSDTAEQALADCSRTVMVLSPSYLRQGWPELENLILQTIPPRQREQRLVTILREPCALPPRISHLTQIDLRPLADSRRNWRRLLHALGAPELREKRPPTRAGWWLQHPFVDAPGFTGRVAERQLLSHWLTDSGEPLMLLRAPFGFGKSSLVWQWLHHDVRPVEWPKILWWSCCGANTGFEDFVFHAVGYFHDLEPEQVAKHSRAEQLQLLLRALESSGRLVVLDGFERWLESDGRLDTSFVAPSADSANSTQEAATPQSSCNRRLTEHFLERLTEDIHSAGRVLLTSRLVPDCLFPDYLASEAPDSALASSLMESDVMESELAPGCLDYRLHGLADADVAAYFHDREIEGTTGEMLRTGAAYDHHPMSLRLLTGILRCDVGNPNDITAARRLNVPGRALDRRQNLLERAYDTLPTQLRSLLDTLTCCRRAVPVDMLFAVHDDERADVADLDELVARGLAQFSPRLDAPALVDLPTTIRRYIYGRLPLDRRRELHGRLRQHYEQRPMPETLRTTGDLADRLELYIHRVRGGDFECAFEQLQQELIPPLSRRLGDPRLLTEALLLLFPGGEERGPKLDAPRDQAKAMAALAMARSFEGRSREALDLRLRVLVLLDGLPDTTPRIEIARASALIDLAISQLDLGQLHPADTTLRRLAELAATSQQPKINAIALRELGRLAIYRGDFDLADSLLTRAQREFEDDKRDKAIGIGLSHRAFYCLSRSRQLMLDDHAASLGPLPRAIEAAKSALEIAEQHQDDDFRSRYDAIRARALLGTAHRRSGDLESAEHHLAQSLRDSIALGHQHAEAGCLLELARLCWDDARISTAEQLSRHALGVTEKCLYVPRQAEVHLLLARFAQERRDPGGAKLHAREAHSLAGGHGPIEWSYRVALDEANALLHQLGAT